MNTYNDDRAERLFAEAMELPAQDRRAFLDRACSDSAELREEVESLLTAHDSAHAFLETPAVSILPTAPPRNADDSGLIGCSIGAYRITRLIGSGGMGRVYESEQVSPKRTVALKLLNTALASSSARRRFEYEAEILARLQHPGIAQIYEAGTHEDRSGVMPYFAMEYVSEGRTILEYARHHELSCRDRLKLFADVCDAVHHGHQKGIVHRDLKPSNILVDPTGTPKIIDFGVARTTAERDGDRTRMTRAGEFVGTLQYMSPEQCAGGADAIDIRSDVYALGLVLYELLTHKRPYDLSDKTVLEAAPIIREGRLQRPSTVERTLRGDLDSIILKALEKERDRRYASAADLAQDIHRFLRREPIEARPPSAVYQFRKLVSRYRFPAVLAGLLFLAITGLAIVSTALSGRLATERDRANAEADTARRIAEFQKDMLIAAAPKVAQGRDVTVREVLDEAADLAGEKLGDSPEVESAIRDTIGQAYYGLARYEEAEAQYVEALNIRREVFGPQDSRTLNTMNNLAVLYADMGRYDEAEPLYRTALAEQRLALGDEHRDTIGCALNFAYLLDIMGNRAESIRLLEDTLAISRDALGPDAPETVTAVNSLAVMYAKEGRLEEAAPLFESAYETALRMNGPDHPRTFTTMNNLARLYENTGRLEEAKEMIEEVIAKREQVLGKDHPATLTSRGNLARILKRLGRLEEAEAVLHDVWTSCRDHLGAMHPETLRAQREHAQGLADLGRNDEAAPQFEAALAGFRELLAPDHEHTVMTALAYGVCLQALERYAESVVLLEEAFAALKTARGIEHPATQRAVRALVDVYDALGDTDHANEYRALLIESADTE